MGLEIQKGSLLSIRKLKQKGKTKRKLNEKTKKKFSVCNEDKAHVLMNAVFLFAKQYI